MTSPNSELTEIPLFPLNLVLYPGMPLPLHIFEERYKAMIGDCMRNNTPFGVPLIRSGQEVGGPADPQRIGTTTRVLRSQLLDGGRMNIMTKGERRFEIIEITQQDPHVAGVVRLLDEPVGESFTGVSSELTEEFSKLMRNLISLSGGYTSQVDVPESPVELSYMIAANLDAPIPVRQELLEVPTAADRLNRLVPLLRRRNHALEEEIARQNPFKGPRLN
jgi:Lon protease-like protein